MKKIDIVVPGLLGPFANELPAHISQELKSADFKLIHKYCSRAEIQYNRLDSYYQTLVQLINSGNTLSVCQLTAAHDGLDISSGFYYRADPVHFKADSDHAILIGTDQVLPDKEETKLLIESFNQHFAEDKLSLHSVNENRWYLRSDRQLNLEFIALDYALARDIKHFMPKGEDALYWRKILNEAQMLFFQHVVNQNRETKGRLTINGLWLWDLSLNLNDETIAQPEQVFSKEALAIALAEQAGIGVQAINNISEIKSDAVLVIDYLYQAICYGDVEAWLDALKQFCKNELLQVEELLASKKVDEVHVYSCSGLVFKVNRFNLMKFWKPNKTITEHISIL
jgi:hypothetical protein